MATNPYVNKVQYGNSTVMDITDTTASEGDVANGEVFYKKSGERATGTAMVAEIPLLPAHGGTGNESGRVQVGQVSGTAVGEYATSEGLNTNASGANSHAEGSGTTASSTCAHAEGMATTASHYYAHAEGANNTASGISSHAEGQNNTASGGSSHAGGFHTTAGYDYQTAIGTYNDNKSTTLFEVGNGTSNSASNAFEVYSDGHVNAQGEYYQGGVNKSAIWDAKVSESLLKDTVGWIGKNELPLTLDKLKSLNTHGTWSGNSFTNNSVTFACEFTSEGYLSKVTVSGTASSAANLFIDKSNGKQPYLGKRLTINGCPSGGSSSTYYINAYRIGTQDGSGGSFQETGNGYTFDYLNNASGTGGNISIGTASGYAASNLVFYPMLRSATIADGTFEPYHDSVEDWYWNINAEIGVHQLFDYNKWKRNILISGGTGVFQNNGVTLTATSDDCFTAYNNSWGNFSPISVKEGQSFTLSWEFSGTGGSTVENVYVFNYANGSVIAKTGALIGSLTFTIPSGVTQISFRVGIHTTGSVGSYSNILLKRADDTNNDCTSYAMTNEELTDSKDTWTGTSTVDSSGNVVFDNLNDDYAYDLYADDVLITYSGMTKGTGTSSGIKLTYATDAPNGTVCKLRILK